MNTEVELLCDEIFEYLVKHFTLMNHSILGDYKKAEERRLFANGMIKALNIIGESGVHYDYNLKWYGEKVTRVEITKTINGTDKEFIRAKEI